MPQRRYCSRRRLFYARPSPNCCPRPSLFAPRCGVLPTRVRALCACGSGNADMRVAQRAQRAQLRARGVRHARQRCPQAARCRHAPPFTPRATCFRRLPFRLIFTPAFLHTGASRCRRHDAAARVAAALPPARAPLIIATPARRYAAMPAFSMPRCRACRRCRAALPAPRLYGMARQIRAAYENWFRFMLDVC